MTVRIADDLDLGTTSNRFSDAVGGAGTLIEKDSPLYDALADLERGDQVVFSGEFVADDESCVRAR